MKRLVKISSKLNSVIEDYRDEGSPNWQAEERHVTRWLTGTINIDYIKDFPGENGETRVWNTNNGNKYFGHYPEKEWNEFLNDIKQNGIKYKILIFVHKNGDIKIAEGNHRIQACIQLGIKEIPVEIRYFGNSQRIQKYFDE